MRRGTAFAAGALTAGVLCGTLSVLGGRAERAAAEGAFEGALVGESVRESHSWKDRQHRTGVVNRTGIIVPESYGEMVSCTGDVLWFRDASGVLRNVHVTGAVQVVRAKTESR